MDRDVIPAERVSRTTGEAVIQFHFHTNRETAYFAFVDGDVDIDDTLATEKSSEVVYMSSMMICCQEGRYFWKGRGG